MSHATTPVPRQEQVPVVPEQKQGHGFMNPTNINDALQIAELLSQSTLVPDDYRGKPNDILVAMELGAEVGLGTLQSLQNISVIGKRPAIWGDALKGLVLGSPLCEYVNEWWDENEQKAYCEAKRTGYPEPHVVSFGIEDARNAGLISGQKVSYSWKTNPKRMCQMRARGFCLRDQFADVLKGLSKLNLADERNVRDINASPDKGVMERGTSKPQVIDSDAEEEERGDKDIPAADSAGSDEATRLAVNMLAEQILCAKTQKEMKGLQKQIVALPDQHQTELVAMWNDQLKVIRSRLGKQKEQEPADDS